MKYTQELGTIIKDYQKDPTQAVDTDLLYKAGYKPKEVLDILGALGMCSQSKI